MNFIVILFILNILFCGGATFYFYLEKKQLDDEEKLSLKRQRLQGEKFEKEKKTLDDDFEQISDKAAFILSESEKLAQDLMQDLEHAIGGKSKTFEPLIQEGINLEEQLGFLREKIKKQYVEKIERMFKQLQNLEIRESKKVENFAEEQEALTDKNIQQIRQESLEKMHKKIDDYKNAEIVLFDEKAKKVVSDAAYDLLGHSLTNGEQEEMVVRAIRKAREDNII